MRNAVTIFLIEHAEEIGQLSHLTFGRARKLPMLEIFLAIPFGIGGAIAPQNFGRVVLGIEADAQQVRLPV